MDRHLFERRQQESKLHVHVDRHGNGHRQCAVRPRASSSSRERVRETGTTILVNAGGARAAQSVLPCRVPSGRHALTSAQDASGASATTSVTSACTWRCHANLYSRPRSADRRLLLFAFVGAVAINAGARSGDSPPFAGRGGVRGFPACSADTWPTALRRVLDH